LGRPADPAILAYFRLVLSLSMAWHVGRLIFHDRIQSHWVQPEFHFSYLGFSWVRPLPGPALYVLCVLIMLAAAAVALGWRHRLCATFLAAGFTYLFLLDRVNYLNHGYLLVLLAWINAALPTQACASIDALRRPDLRKESVPLWTVWLLRFQVGIVYFFGGIAKLNHDWLRGSPMRDWLQDRGQWPVVGPFFRTEFAPWFFSYGGLGFDLLIVPALLWPRTRAAAFLVCVLFHLANSQLFTIGVFPWMAIALTAVFFDPSWPRTVLDRLRRRRLNFAASRHNARSAPPPAHHPPSRRTLAALALYAALQLVIPLRHYLYPGNVSWTEEGHEFSWHMMLRSKKLQAASFFVVKPLTKQSWKLDPMAWLTPRQFSEMAGEPELVRQFCAHVAAQMRQAGHPDAEVRAVLYVRLNDHPPALLVDPAVDLGRMPHTMGAASWILPIEEPLRARGAPPSHALAIQPPTARSASGHVPAQIGSTPANKFSTQ